MRIFISKSYAPNFCEIAMKVLGFPVCLTIDIDPELIYEKHSTSKDKLYKICDELDLNNFGYRWNGNAVIYTTEQNAMIFRMRFSVLSEKTPTDEYKALRIPDKTRQDVIETLVHSNREYSEAIKKRAESIANENS